MMDKINSDVETIIGHNINIMERKNINLTGVKKIESFDNEEFLLETTLGYIIIKGEGLEMVKLDTYQGNVSIKGLIKSLTYIEENKPKQEGGLFNKLFK
jgi:sporulation protein YabP